MTDYKEKISSIFSPFMIIVFTALVAQLIGTYHAKSLILGDYFYLLWVILRIALPIAVLLALKVPLSKIGLGLPRFDRLTKILVIVAGVILVAAFGGIYFFKGYFNFYSAAFADPYGSSISRFINFMIFTGSTLTGWEFLHRGFILMGLYYLLSERDAIPAETAAGIAIATAWVFEVVFHFIKPELEAVGLLVGSPLLSWLALRMRSIWVPFLLHFLVELLFIATLIMQ
jgi:membrane protease YdiL (CAAX protease family)